MDERLILSLLIGALAGIGTYLMLQASLVRLLLGLTILSSAINLFVFASSELNKVAPVGQISEDFSKVADPLPQALILTAIVIGFGLICFMMGIILKLSSTSKCDDLRLFDREE